ncbi:hypothetical protein [Paracoccus sp. TOH]|uniref:hypothetical protein n=1 Tax=Paracoccus sp. TOH TaxID=1263728 RepID=UPI0025AF72FE|nr:hypothetical protein [Paracoccus sp. TOH]WJS83322.1 hypothetical protein NBE95_05910 [Paracoccus sp. TOH]
MRPAALRLDSFAAGQARPARPRTAAEVEEAFHRGHEQGLAEGRERSLDALTQALAEIRQDMLVACQAEAALRREINAGLAPVLQAIVALLAPRSERERLRDALAGEIARLVEHAPDCRLVLRCPADLQPDLAECLDRAGLAEAQVENLSAGARVVELLCGQGRIVFDPARVAADLTSIIDDIMTEE